MADPPRKKKSEAAAVASRRAAARKRKRRAPFAWPKRIDGPLTAPSDYSAFVGIDFGPRNLFVAILPNDSRDATLLHFDAHEDFTRHQRSIYKELGRLAKFYDELPRLGPAPLFGPEEQAQSTQLTHYKNPILQAHAQGWTAARGFATAVVNPEAVNACFPDIYLETNSHEQNKANTVRHMSCLVTPDERRQLEDIHAKHVAQQAASDAHRRAIEAKAPRERTPREKKLLASEKRRVFLPARASPRPAVGEALPGKTDDALDALKIALLLKTLATGIDQFALRHSSFVGRGAFPDM
jgi:hypothetical protein